MVAEGYKETEIGVIPEDWEVQIFENISELKRGTSFTKKNLVEGDIPVIAGGKEPAYYHNDYNRDGDTITLSGSGANAGYVNFFTTKIFMSDGFTVKGKKNISLTKYLFYFLKNKQEQIYYLQSGGAQPHIYTKNVASIPIPLPPLKEQEKIADILSTADKKIDAIALQIQKAQTLKKGLLQKLLSEGIGHSEFKDSELGKIPESWEVVELEKLLTFKNGVNASKEQYGKGYRFINVLDIINNLTIQHDDIIGLVDIDEKEFELYEVKYGDILFQRSSETRAEVGQSNVYLDKEQSATFGGFVIKGSAKQEYNPVFMNYLFKIPIIRKQITSKSGGSTRYNIGQSSLNEVIVQFPPLQEQKQIADILSTADEKLEILRAKKEKYETLKKGLLQKLLSGEVRV